MHRIIYPKSTKIRSWELFSELKIVIFNLFMRVKKIKICQIWSYSFMFGMNVILNNINFHDQPSRMYRFPPRSRKQCSNSKKKGKQVPVAAPPNIMAIWCCAVYSSCLDLFHTKLNVPSWKHVSTRNYFRIYRKKD